MKRMIISGLVGLGDLWGYFSTTKDFLYFKRTGEYPTPDIGREFLGEIILWSIIFGVCAIVFIFGLLAYRRNNQ